MNILKKLSLAAPLLFLSGCSNSGGSGNPGFLIIDKMEGTGQITYQVQVPAGASMSDEAAWTKYRGDTYSKTGKQVVANFYEGAMSADNLKAQCDGNGSCTTMQ